ncbi:MAG TPA: PEP-CTERM sorting domain-containing protein [Verrucomicrobiae bacterium]|jgi:hypothetical protein
MKKTLITVSVLSGAIGAMAQGNIEWNDGQTFGTISIMSPNPATSGVEEVGQTSYDSPQGSATYSGGWLGGTSTAPGGGVGLTPTSGTGGYNYQLNGNFTAGLYLDTSLQALTTDITSGTPVATSGIQGGGAAGLWGSSALVAVDNNIAPGTKVFVGIAAWYSGGGAGSYVAASSLPEGYVESTSEVTLGGGGPPPIQTPGLANLGLTSFSLAQGVPEPSTVALGIIGASSFLMRVRRKK